MSFSDFISKLKILIAKLWVVNPVPQPVPIPTPVPVPPVPTPVPQPAPAIQYVVWDANLIPTMMRAQGFQHGNDNALFFALFSTYGDHEWGNVGTNPEDIALYIQSSSIKSWFSAIVADIGNKLNANSISSATLIVNDRNDTGGCFMINPIKNQLLQMGVNPQQITDGNIFTL